MPLVELKAPIRPHSECLWLAVALVSGKEALPSWTLQPKCTLNSSFTVCCYNCQHSEPSVLKCSKNFSTNTNKNKQTNEKD